MDHRNSEPQRRSRLPISLLIVGSSIALLMNGVAAATEEHPALAESAATAEALVAAAAPAERATAAETPESELDRVATQIQAGELDDAKRWLEADIRNLESQTHRYDPALVRPLTLLGDIYQAQHNYPEALLNYERATHVARVSHGLKSIEQLESVYREATTYKTMGAFQKASDREEYAFRILAERAGPNDPELLPALYRLAEWYITVGNPYAARSLYQRALGILNTTGQLESVDAIPALQGLANTFRLERFPLDYDARPEPVATMLAERELPQPVSVNNFPAGEQALQQIIRIRQQQAADYPEALVDAVLDLADWYTLFDKSRRATPLYAHAFELLSDNPNVDRTAYFAEPRLLYFPRPGLPKSAKGDSTTATQTRRGYVELGFEVSDTGMVRDLTTIAAEPPGLMDLRVRRSMRVARYRPALVDGIAVNAPRVLFRHDFSYEASVQEDEDAGPDNAVTTEELSEQEEASGQKGADGSGESVTEDIAPGAESAGAAEPIERQAVKAGSTDDTDDAPAGEPTASDDEEVVEEASTGGMDPVER